MHDIEELRGADIFCVGKCKIGTWNVEGLTDSKIVELQNIMEERGLGMMCLQETHRLGADYFLINEGYLVILSGGPSGSREWAGVGFLVTPIFRRSILRLDYFSDRIASLKLKVLSGQMRIIIAYFPHMKYDYIVRTAFYDILSDYA